MRDYGSRGPGSPAPMSLEPPMMSFDEGETKPEVEAGGGTETGKGGGGESKWKTEEITKAQGILLEMILWLRGKGVIEDVILYLKGSKEKEELWGAGGGAEGGGGEGEGWMKRLFTVLQQDGYLEGSSTDEIQEGLGVDDESFAEFMKWGVRCGKFTVRQ